MIFERLDNSNEKCKPMFGFTHEKILVAWDCQSEVPGSNPYIYFFYSQSLRSTKHELFSAVDFDGVIGGVFFKLFL